VCVCVCVCVSVCVREREREFKDNRHTGIAYYKSTLELFKVSFFIEAIPLCCQYN